MPYGGKIVEIMGKGNASPSKNVDSVIDYVTLQNKARKLSINVIGLQISKLGATPKQRSKMAPEAQRFCREIAEKNYGQFIEN